MSRTLCWIVVGGALGACAAGPSPCSDDCDPGVDVEPTLELVAQELRALPTWEEFSPPRPDVAPQPVPGAEPTLLPLSEPRPRTTIGEDGAISVVEDVVYECQEIPYTMTATPDELVMYDPDVDILWPGALLQGRSHAYGVGLLDGLPIAERAPLEVSIPGLLTGDNLRVVEHPTLGTVQQAVGEMIGNATVSEIPSASSVSFQEATWSAEEQFALSVDVSGRYLNFSGSANADIQRTEGKTTVTAQFVQRMFTVAVAPPSRPTALFGDDFTIERYREEVALGRMGPDNLPVYVSTVVYGRMMTFSLTSSASESQIRSALQASYDGLLVDAEVQLSAEQRAVLAEAEIAVSTRGGSVESALAVIRDGDWRAYFDAGAPLSTAEPLSYTFRNLADNTVANVTESTEFTVRSCTSRLQGELFDVLEPQQVPSPLDGPYSAHTGDFDGDGFGDVLWNARSGGVNALYVGWGTELGVLEVDDEVFTHPDTGRSWQAYAVRRGDFDGDGATDLAWIRAESDLHEVWVVRFDDARDAVFSDISRAQGAQAPAGSPYVGDVDGDGRDDVFVKEVVEIAQFLPRQVYGSAWTGFDGQRFAQSHPPGLVTVTGYEDRLRLADVDGDGRDELIDVSHSIVGNAGFLQIAVVSVSGPPFTYDSDFVSDPSPFDNPQGLYYGFWGAVDEQTLEYVGVIHDSAVLADGRPRGIVTALGGQGSYTFTHPVDDDWLAFRRPDYGDFDGNGRLDVLWARNDAQVNELYVGYRLGSSISFGAPKQTVHWPEADWSRFETPLVVDVDGDGRDDLVWNRREGTNRWYVGLASRN